MAKQEIDRNARPDPAVLAVKYEQLVQQLAIEPSVELERIQVVYEALLNGKPIPRHLGTPIVSFDGSVSFAHDQSQD
jgi:hypothetical protein